MAKLTLSDLSNLQNESSAVGVINSNSTATENALENTLSRNGLAPNQMEADFDMNSHNILNLPETTESGNAISYGQVIDLIDSLENGAVITAPFVVMSADTQLTDERVLTAGANIGIADGGAGSTVTISISGDDLNAYENLTTTGLVARTGTGTVETRTLTAPAAGITVTDGDGVAGDPTLVLANDLAALEGLSTNGIITRTATDTATTRTITGTANEITLTNGDGVSGNPTVSIPAAVTFTGKTITGGTYSSPTVNTPTLTVLDNAFTVQDNSDPTKQLQLQASGISAATTRTLTAPDANTTIVGTDVSQTLTNKTIALGSNTVSGTTAQFNTALSDNDFATLAGSETLTNKTVNLTSNTLTGTTAQFNTALSDNDFATLAGSETLTNKTINLTSNTLSGTRAQFNTAMSDDNFVSLTGTETLTNKTLTSPIITSPNLNMGSDAQGDVLYHNGTQYVRLGPGTSGHFLKTNGAAANPAWAAVPGGGDLLAANNLSDVSNVATSRANLQAFKQTLLTPIATTSGTSHDWTIPTGCKEFSMTFQQVSQSSTAVPTIQLGDAGGIETTGYVGSTVVLVSAAGVTGANHSSGIFLSAGTHANTNVQSGVVHFVLVNSSTFLWAYHGTIAYSDVAGVVNLAGIKTLSQELTTVRLTVSSGAFDFGSVNVLYTSP